MLCLLSQLRYRPKETNIGAEYFRQLYHYTKFFGNVKRKFEIFRCGKN